MINEAPAIAVFNYSREGYSVIQIEEGEVAGFAVAEFSGQLFVYVAEDYEAEELVVRLESGKQQVVDVTGKKGQLFVMQVV